MITNIMYCTKKKDKDQDYETKLITQFPNHLKTNILTNLNNDDDDDDDDDDESYSDDSYGSEYESEDDDNDDKKNEKLA